MLLEESFTQRFPSPVRSPSLIDHLFIIRGLILRNLRLKYHHRPAGFFLEFLRPIIIDVMHYYIFTAINKGMPANIPVEEFVWAGFAVWFVFTGIWMPVKVSLVLPTVSFPGVTAMHARIALCIWPIIINVVFLYASLALMMMFGDNVQFPNLPLTLLIMTITAALALGLGLVVGAVSIAIPAIDPFLHMLPWFLFISSGIYASIYSSPRFMQEILIWSPTIHLVEYERYALHPGYPTSLISLTYPSICAITLILLGLLMTKRRR